MKRFAIFFVLPILGFGIFDLFKRASKTNEALGLAETHQPARIRVSPERVTKTLPSTKIGVTPVTLQQSQARYDTYVDALLRSLDGLGAVAREELIASVIEGLVQSDSNEAARFAEATHQTEAMETVANMWAQQDAPAAAAWTEKHMTSKPEMVAALISSWAVDDTYAASAWLAKVPAGPGRDAGAVLLIAELMESDPDSARAWIQDIGDSAIRGGMESQLTTVQSNAQTTASVDSRGN